jgi:hypothetical protein
MGIPMNAFDTTTATDLITDAKDNDFTVTVHLADGTAVIGDPISVNSKGVNLKIDGKVRSFGLTRVTGITVDNGDDEDDMTDEEIYAELGDGMTTAELAAHLSDSLNLDMTPKELRVHLRALGLGVGKGRKYSLTATEYRMVKDLVLTPAN